MFEVGKAYEFTFLTATEDGLSEVYGRRWIIQAVEGSLLHLRSPADDSSDSAEIMFPAHEETMILNTASPFFHRARLADEIDAEDKRRADLAEKWRIGKRRS